MISKGNNFAYIDGQNLNLGAIIVSSDGDFYSNEKAPPRDETQRGAFSCE